MGAVLRFLVERGATVRIRSTLPVGTLLVNLLGSFLLGALVGLDTSADVLRLLGIGLLGSFTTFSTWMFETHILAKGGFTRLATLNVLLSLLLGLLCVWSGHLLGASL